MNWLTAPLGEVARIERRGVNPADLVPETLYLGLEHIERGGRILGYLTLEQAELASTKFQFDDCHILYGKLRPNLGKVARPDFEGICSTDILPIRPGPRLDRAFLQHFLKQPAMVEFAASRASGANLPRLSPGVLAAFVVPLPPLDEQRRIAAILDLADALRAKRHQAIAHLDDLTQSIFQEIFDRSTIAVNFGDVIVQGPTNGLYRPSSDYGSGVPILRIDGFDSGAVKAAPWKRVRIPVSDLKRYSLLIGDIVINRVNALSHLGKSALIEHLDEPSVYESNMMRIRLDKDRVSPRFVIAWLRSASVKQQILSKAKKAINQASINQGDVRSLLMPLPSRELQSTFARRVEKVEAQRAVVRRALVTNEVLFASLQSAAFRGEL